jgi:hypothetical protein
MRIRGLKNYADWLAKFADNELIQEVRCIAVLDHPLYDSVRKKWKYRYSRCEKEATIGNYSLSPCQAVIKGQMAKKKLWTLTVRTTKQIKARTACCKLRWIKNKDALIKKRKEHSETVAEETSLRRKSSTRRTRRRWLTRPKSTSGTTRRPSRPGGTRHAQPMEPPGKKPSRQGSAEP